ncbi:MAG: SHOCT domain-containing protein [Ferruginibacter sp.]|nr:SHOCT domain-containing protein [Ferruginibacter sp.]
MEQIDQLAKLKELLDSDAISQEEYQTLKNKILNSPKSGSENSIERNFNNKNSDTILESHVSSPSAKLTSDTRNVILLSVSILLLAFVLGYIIINMNSGKNASNIENNPAFADSGLSKPVNLGKNKNKYDRESNNKEDKSQLSNQSNEINNDYLNNNLEKYRSIMTNYYYDLTNDNYDNLLRYYPEVVDGFMDYKSTNKYDIVNGHRSYNDKYSYHIYKLTDIKPYKLDGDIRSYFVKMNISLKNDESEDFKTHTVNDIFFFNSNDKIVNVKLIK